MLIGSRAFDFWRPGILRNDKRDWDIITDNPPTTNLFVEVHHPHEYLSDEFVKKFQTDNFVAIGGQSYSICSLRGLSAIKMSHLSLDHNWIKHISFFHKYLKEHFNHEDWELVKRREKITLEITKQKNPSLMMGNQQFFDDAVKKVYDHDWLHERVAFFDRPLYERLKFSNKTDLAWCEKDLWEKFTHQEKMMCVVEETTVIALERFLIPGREKYATAAYMKALQKVCTSLTSGWFRDFAIWNWADLRLLARVELMDKLTEELKI